MYANPNRIEIGPIEKIEHDMNSERNEEMSNETRKSIHSTAILSHSALLASVALYVFLCGEKREENDNGQI